MTDVRNRLSKFAERNERVKIIGRVCPNNPKKNRKGHRAGNDYYSHHGFQIEGVKMSRCLRRRKDTTAYRQGNRKEKKTACKISSGQPFLGARGKRRSPAESRKQPTGSCDAIANWRVGSVRSEGPKEKKKPRGQEGSRRIRNRGGFARSGTKGGEHQASASRLVEGVESGDDRMQETMERHMAEREKGGVGVGSGGTLGVRIKERVAEHSAAGIVGGPALALS